MNDRTNTSAPDPLAGALAQILARLESMDARLAALEAPQPPGIVPTAGHPVVDSAPPDEPAGPGTHAGTDDGERRALLSRRGLIAGVTALGAAGAAVLAGAEPAAAANGDPILAGGATTATSVTSVTANLPNTATLSAYNPATGNAAGIYAVAGSSANIGGFGAVVGDSNNQPGLTGLSGSRSGVVGKTKTGFYGVDGSTDSDDPDSAGVKGENTGNGDGVYGRTASPLVNIAGVHGNNSGDGIGVKGVANTGFGVSGETFAGSYGVIGRTSKTDLSSAGVFGGSLATGSGVYGLAGSGPGVRAESTGGPAVFAASPFANLRLSSGAVRVAPINDNVAHTRGDVVADTTGILWFCTSSGTPGTWRRLAGPASAGQLHVLPTPVRIYDSRTGSTPAQGPKSKLTSTPRPIDCTHNSSGVPVGATAVSLTVLLVNAANANGNMTIWANGVAQPAANTAVWGTGSGRYTTTAICALDANAKIQVAASKSTDLALDVIGYYR